MAPLERLGELVGAEGVVVISSRGWMTDMAIEVGDPAIYRPDLLRAFDAHWTEHPFMVSDLSRPRTGVRRLSDRVARRESSRRDLVDTFYRPLGMANELSVQLAWDRSGSMLAASPSIAARRPRGAARVRAAHHSSARPPARSR